ncbi:phage tail tube protein [Nocardioides campestrisoli]|uniref:phage tail tube protein n=1 Tax=Nocardioides campestrisoli TaxID=2736757 RepID=UPI0015E7DA03|nr:hypothetical protein [Nocardioides campestrisoli]
MVLAAPPRTKALANTVVVFLTTPPAAASGIPTLAEVNAALFAQCHLYTEFEAVPNQGSGAGPRPICEESSETEFGQTTYEPVELQYSYMPQELGTPGAAGNEVYEALEPGTYLTAVVLHGVYGKTDTLAAGDIADVFRVEPGKRRKGRTGDGEFDKKAVTQAVRIVGGGPVVEDHPLATAA